MSFGETLITTERCKRCGYTFIAGDMAHVCSGIGTSLPTAAAPQVPSHSITTTIGGIGDVKSDAKGSGARYNSGKPDYSLVNLCLMANALEVVHGVSDPIKAIWLLGRYQATHNTSYLMDIVKLLGEGGWPECAEVFTYGKVKYAAWNWAKGMPWSVPLASCARHLLAMLRGETHDPESGKSHRGHVFCNVVMLLTYAATYQEGNDLPAKGLLA